MERAKVPMRWGWRGLGSCEVFLPKRVGHITPFLYRDLRSSNVIIEAICMLWWNQNPMGLVLWHFQGHIFQLCVTTGLLGCYWDLKSRADPAVSYLGKVQL